MYSENHLKITKLMFLCTSLLVMVAFVATMAHSEGSIGVGFSQSVDGEVSVGVQGQYETGKVEIDYDYQGIDFHDAKVNLAYRHSFSWIEASIFQENDWTGYSPTNLNRTNDLGITASVPYIGLDWEVAVFGRNGNTAAPIVKYDEDTGDIISEVPGTHPGRWHTPQRKPCDTIESA